MDKKESRILITFMSVCMASIFAVMIIGTISSCSDDRNATASNVIHLHCSDSGCDLGDLDPIECQREHCDDDD